MVCAWPVSLYIKPLYTIAHKKNSIYIIFHLLNFACIVCQLISIIIFPTNNNMRYISKKFKSCVYGFIVFIFFVCYARKAQRLTTHRYSCRSRRALVYVQFEHRRHKKIHELRLKDKMHKCWESYLRVSSSCSPSSYNHIILHPQSKAGGFSAWLTFSDTSVSPIFMCFAIK